MGKSREWGGTAMRNRNLRKIRLLVTAQTAHNLEKLAAMAGYGDQAGRVVDKLVRDRMVELRSIERTGKKDET